jgi:hypothetical protein
MDEAERRESGTENDNSVTRINGQAGRQKSVRQAGRQGRQGGQAGRQGGQAGRQGRLVDHHTHPYKEYPQAETTTPSDTHAHRATAQLVLLAPHTHTHTHTHNRLWAAEPTCPDEAPH